MAGDAGVDEGRHDEVGLLFGEAGVEGGLLVAAGEEEGGRKESGE